MQSLSSQRREIFLDTPPNFLYSAIDFNNLDKNMTNSIAYQPVIYHRPAPGTKTGRVWEIADELTREKGRRASRQEVIAHYRAENGNSNTAHTQYQYWKIWHEQEGAPADPPSPSPGDIKPQTLKVAPDGRLLVPAAMREAMLLDDGGHVTARVEAGELRVASPAVAVKQVQACMRKYRQPGESVVDQFLAARPALWGES